MRTALRILACGLLPLSPLTFLHAQTMHSPTIPQASAVISNPSKVMHLDVDVDDKKGAPIQGLTESDFTVLDNGAKPNGLQFKAVAAGQGQLEVILVMDAVNSSFQTVSYEQQQLEKYLKTPGLKLPNPTSLAYITDKGAEIQKGFTQDGGQLELALEKISTGLRFITRNTGYWGNDERYSTSFQALDQILTYCSQLPGRKVVIWVSPGWPLMSGVRTELDGTQEKEVFQQIVAESALMRYARVTMDDINPRGLNSSLLRDYYYREFTKGVSKLSDVYLGDLGLQVLAEQSGGKVIEADNDISRSVARLMDNTSSWYEFNFPMPAAEKPNEFHSTEVKVDKPDAKAHTRVGYYNQPAK